MLTVIAAVGFPVITVGLWCLLNGVYEAGVQEGMRKAKNICIMRHSDI